MQWGGAPVKTKKRRPPKKLVESFRMAKKGQNNLAKTGIQSLFTEPVAIII